MTALRLRLRRMAGAPDRPSPFAIWADPASWPAIGDAGGGVFVARAMEALGVMQFGLNWIGCTYPGSDAWTPEAHALAEQLRFALGDGWGEPGDLRVIRSYVVVSGSGGVQRVNLTRQTWAEDGEWLTILRSCRYLDASAGGGGFMFLDRADFLAFVDLLPSRAPGERWDAARFAELVPPLEATDEEEERGRGRPSDPLADELAAVALGLIGEGRSYTSAMAAFRAAWRVAKFAGGCPKASAPIWRRVRTAMQRKGAPDGWWKGVPPNNSRGSA
ncbi:hypothetical protein V5F79_08330 [Xanthobacter flavus]|uniref:hypothetical protein n=1 Tax=Xanthobacter flavus TaxID=281 RepID=UPI00372BA38A